MLKIKFTLFNENRDGGVSEVRFAQDRSKTFDNSFTVWKESEAKVFHTHKQAHRWLARHGFMKRTHSKFNSTGYRFVDILPGLFSEIEITAI